MTRPVAIMLVLLVLLFIVVPGGTVLYAATRPCPYTPLGVAPGVEVVCDWWDITCQRCY